MKVAVWDTYVQRADGSVMHFDILVDSESQKEGKIYGFGKEYLASKPFNTGDLSSNECQFCHIEQVPKVLANEISQKGYSIIEIDNCN